MWEHEHECGCHHVHNVVGRSKDLEAWMLMVWKLVRVVTKKLRRWEFLGEVAKFSQFY